MNGVGIVDQLGSVDRTSVGRCESTAVNVSQYLTLRAAERPQQPAIINAVATKPRSHEATKVGPGSISSVRPFVATALARPIDNRSRRTSGTIDNRASLSFARLEDLVNCYASGLLSAGFTPRMRVLLMLRPGVDFVAVTFAMFRMGVVPVMIDPGMGIARMLECIRQVDVQGFIGVPLAHVMRVLRPRTFRQVRHVVTGGRRWFWGGQTLSDWRRRGQCRIANGEYRMNNAAAYSSAAHSPAAILFTSGSTGPAKGVVYEHSMFDAQVRMIQSQYGIEPGEVDLPTFPVFGLFSIAMGMAVVIPEMDASRPARADPAKIVRDIQRYGVTNTFGSPALWRNVGAYCVAKGIKLPTLRRILIAGAPVPWRTIEQLHSVLGPEAKVHTPYGATEALPVSTIAGAEILGGCRGGMANGESRIANAESRMATGLPDDAQFGLEELKSREYRHSERSEESPDRGREEYLEILRCAQNDAAAAACSKAICRDPGGTGDGTRELTRKGAGICVGRPVAGTQVRIIRASDEPILNWSEDLLISAGEVGEIVVSGDVVTHQYFGLPHATAMAKIRDGATIWHRMGDLGYVDADGRIWFCGRKNHRVETAEGTLFSVCCEAIFNEHPEVARCALVGLGPRGSQLPVIVIEPASGRVPGRRAAEKLKADLLSLAAANEITAGTWDLLFRRSLPVDVRHNAKINREWLASWATKKMAGCSRSC